MLGDTNKYTHLIVCDRTNMGEHYVMRENYWHRLY